MLSIDTPKRRYTYARFHHLRTPTVIHSYTPSHKKRIHDSHPSRMRPAQSTTLSVISVTAISSNLFIAEPADSCHGRHSRLIELRHEQGHASGHVQHRHHEGSVEGNTIDSNKNDAASAASAASGHHHRRSKAHSARVCSQIWVCRSGATYALARGQTHTLHTPLAAPRLLACCQ